MGCMEYDPKQGERCVARASGRMKTDSDVKAMGIVGI